MIGLWFLAVCLVTFTVLQLAKHGVGHLLRTVAAALWAAGDAWDIACRAWRTKYDQIMATAREQRA